jgi:ABC-type phosphate/phosphonate transport system substrate-binding protein
MCGFPLATRYRDVRPLVAPVTECSATDGPSYRSVWLVRADSTFDTLESTFGQRIGWTVEHSHSGFNAPRHALLAYRSAARPRLYRASIGPLEHPRAAVAALVAGQADVVAIDAYWWALLERHDPLEARRIRSIGTTDEAPMPPLVCSPAFPSPAATELIEALVSLDADPAAQPHLRALALKRFTAVERRDYACLAQLDRDAIEAGYPIPA